MVVVEEQIQIVLTINEKVRAFVIMNVTDHDSYTNFQNLSENVSESETSHNNVAPPKWGVLAIVFIIMCTALGNLLVCLAVIWDRRLQNMTNYFLMSLAIADFLVSILVMPFGMIVELFGTFPLEPEFCTFWVTMDVLMCTASIWHMCTMSMDRFFTLKYPMKYGRNKTKMTVALKILFVWMVSITISSPICVFGIHDPSSVYNDGVCVPTLKNFVIYGSIFAFYIPLAIMLVTYLLTIRILWKNQKMMKKIDRSDFKSIHRFNGRCDVKNLLSPHSEEGEKSRSVYNEVSETDATILGNKSHLNSPTHPTGTEKYENRCPESDEFPAGENSYSKFKMVSHDSHSSNLNQNDTIQIKISDSHLKCDGCSTPNKLDQRASSMSCLESSSDEFTKYKGNSNCHLKTPHYDNFLRVSSNRCLSSSVDTRNIHSAVSCSMFQARSTQSPNHLLTTKPHHFHSCSDIGKPDLKFVEWKVNYTQIQKEMDQILKDSDKEKRKKKKSQNTCNESSDEESTLVCSNKYYQSNEGTVGINSVDVSISKIPSQENTDKTIHRQSIYENSEEETEILAEYTEQLYTTNSERDIRTSQNSAEDTSDLLESGGRKVLKLDDTLKSCQSSTYLSVDSQHSMALSDSEESYHEIFETSSNSSEYITIELKPTKLHMFKVNRSKEMSNASSPLLRKHRSNMTNGYSYNIKNLNQIKDHKQKQKSNSHLHKMLSRFNKSQGITQGITLMSKRATTNERKASKVLGIIFGVFVILWTPFFTVNILSVTCTNCMHSITPEIMSVFLWMGYVASLANPIIYTMFNTAFRNAFIRILKCQICRTGSLLGDRATMSYPMSFNNTVGDRRSTMIHYFKEDVN